LIGFQNQPVRARSESLGSAVTCFIREYWNIGMMECWNIEKKTYFIGRHENDGK
jgi:hypothetical protein